MATKRWTRVEIRVDLQSHKSKSYKDHYSIGLASFSQDEHWPLLVTGEYTIYKRTDVDKVRYELRTVGKSYLVATIAGKDDIMTTKISSEYWTRYGRIIKIKFSKDNDIKIKGNITLPSAIYCNGLTPNTGNLYIQKENRLPFYLALLTVAMFYSRRLNDIQSRHSTRFPI